MITQAHIDALPEEIDIDAYKDDQTTYVCVDGDLLDIRVSQAVHNHSEQFNWSYGGSGPAQTALAILMEFLPYKLAHDYHHPFKFRVVAAWPQTDEVKVKVPLREVIQKIFNERRVASNDLSM